MEFAATKISSELETKDAGSRNREVTEKMKKASAAAEKLVSCVESSIQQKPLPKIVKKKPVTLDPHRFFGGNPETLKEQEGEEAPELEELRARTNNKIRVQGTQTDPETDTPAEVERYIEYEELVGNTPLIDLSHLVRNKHGKPVRVFAKCEFMNPGFSIKDRIVRNILDCAEESGDLKPGGTVVAASSGNTGAATAMFCAMRGYHCIITTSQKCSKEKMDAIRAYGATLIVSPSGVKEGNPLHYMELAQTLCKRNQGWFDMNQYDNLKNPEGHYLTLGPEIWDQTNGKITHFVAAGSTGGTVSGTGKYLKEMNPSVRVILGDPIGSIFTNYFKTGELGTAGKFVVEGVGKGSIPGAMNFDIVDDVVPVSCSESFSMCHYLAQHEGLCAGGSSGLNVRAALEVANNLTHSGVVVTVMPDLGVKYLSKVYNPTWLEENNIQLDQLPVYLNDSPECETPLNTTAMPVYLAEIPSQRYKDLVGNTPLVDVTSLLQNPKHPETRVLAKCEFFNPGFSIKDRIVQNILDKAEKSGDLKPGGTVVAASSGNTGAATAMMCAMRGYKCVIITSPKCSKEKMDAIRAYGAELLVSEAGAKEGTPGHYMEMAKTLKTENADWFDVDQYDNLKNPEGHYLTLGPEIMTQTNGSVTHFIAAGSTGGTISGVGRYLKEAKPDTEVVLADPVGSIFAPYFKTGRFDKPGKFMVEGVGKGSIPGAMDFKLIDDCVCVLDQEAFDMCSLLSRSLGICAGGSAGLNVHAALKVAQKLEKPGVVVTVMPDLGVKYLSKVYNVDWLIENGFEAPCTETPSGDLDLGPEVQSCNDCLQ